MFPALMFTRFAENKFVYTMHHVHERPLSAIYQFFPSVEFVAISEFQRHRENMPRMRTIPHGIDLTAIERKTASRIT